MKRIGFVLPYFGNLNRLGYFRQFLASFAGNPDVDLFLFTDDRADYPYPENVHVRYTNLERVRERFSDTLGFKVCLPSPYKLCDFKIAYGEAFADELRGLDYWGYMDCDMILGDLRRVLTDDLLSRHDKIFTLGHMTLFKNEDSITAMYRRAPGAGYNTDYRRALTSPDIYAIDEWGRDGGINQIFRLNGASMYDGYEFDDISTQRTGLRPEHKMRNPPYHKMTRNLYAYDGRSLKRVSLSYGAAVAEEVLYIHLQKRTMANNLSDQSAGRFLIRQNSFEDYGPVGESDLLALPEDRFDWAYLKIYAERVIHHFKK